MVEPIAYLNGTWVPFSEAKLSVADLGIVQAATITEMIRTFGHRPFRVDEHLDRLLHSLDATGIADLTLIESLPPVIDRITRENTKLLATSLDLGIVIVVTAGVQPMYAGTTLMSQGAPTVCVHSFPLPFERWSAHYTEGAHLIVPSVQAMPSATIDPRIKSRSRLHWFLADREVRETDPAAMALLVDEQGHLTETNSGNLILFDGEALLTPPEDRVLGGISQEVVAQLALSAGVARHHRTLQIEDAQAATEAFVSSTTYCLLPVTRINDRPIGMGAVGPLYQRLIEDWSALVDTDIIAQSQQAARDRTA